MLLIILLSILLFIIYSQIIQQIYNRYQDPETIKREDNLWLLFTIIIFSMLFIVLYILIFKKDTINIDDNVEEIELPDTSTTPLTYEQAKKIARENLLREKYDLLQDK